METQEFITIRSYSDHILADIIISALHEANIKTFQLNESHTMLPSENVEIKIHKSDVDAALPIILMHEPN